MSLHICIRKNPKSTPLIACVQGMYTILGLCLMLVVCKYEAASCDIGVRCEKYEGCQG